jgi:uncharacterized repeat protein (TIGR03803 family)
VQAPDGALYGTTYIGGSYGYGTVFKLNLDGSGYTNLHQFGGDATDGRDPLGALTVGSDGLLYGTTSLGGTHGSGNVFKLRGDGSGYAVLQNFSDAGSGGEPQAGLMEGSDGALYGTTSVGPGTAYGGTAFAINKDGTSYRVLHLFGPFSSNDGVQPLASLLEGSDGALYGTTSTGGGGAVGSVFRINKNGSGYQKLYAFGFGAGVINPFANLLEGSDRALYGTGGGGGGGVFKLNKDGSSYQVLHGFNGDWPFAALIKGRDKALYSTTVKGGGTFGSLGPGTVFRLNEDGSGFEVLYTFGDFTGDGVYPHSALLLASDGAFYGTTYTGGDFVRGTVFRLLFNHIPTVQCADVVVSADTNCVADASVDHGSFDLDGDPITVVQSPAGPYPLGTNRVTLTVTDSFGDSNSCTASVIVLDTTPPSITCPSDITLEFTSDAGAPAIFTARATDDCDPNPAVASVPPSGSTFPVGTTQVQSTAIDAGGNQASCAFAVTVLGARGVKQNVLAELIALRASLPHNARPAGREALDEAIGHLRASLDPAWWADETHLQLRTGLQVFDEEQAAAVRLCSLLHRRTGGIPDTLVEDIIARLDRADHLLAAVAVQDAISAGEPHQRIHQAQRFLAQGAADAQVDPCGDTITDYRRAWFYSVSPHP